MLNKLIKLADKFDNYGDVAIANKIDRLIKLCLERQEVKPWPEGESWPARFPSEEAIPSSVQQAIRQIDEGHLEGDEEQERDLTDLGPGEFKYDPEYYQKTVRPEHLEKARKYKKRRQEMGKSLDSAIESLEREEFLPEGERSEKAKEHAIPELGKKDFKYDPEWYKSEVKRRREKQREMDRTSEDVTTKLVSLADKFDREGKFELADAVDGVITSKAARPKAPLKGLNDNVKKSLILFVIDADKNMKSSTKGLRELFKRMRYFDIPDSIKELGLDKVVKDMEKTQECLDGAKKNFFAMTFGKYPSKADIEKIEKELGKENKESDDGQDALDFFSEYADDEFDDMWPPKVQEVDESELEGERVQEVDEPELESPDDDDDEDEDEGISDEDFEKFMNSLEDADESDDTEPEEQESEDGE